MEFPANLSREGLSRWCREGPWRVFPPGARWLVVETQEPSFILHLASLDQPGSDFFLECLYILVGDAVRRSFEHRTRESVEELVAEVLASDGMPSRLRLWAERSSALLAHPSGFDDAKWCGNEFLLRPLEITQEVLERSVSERPLRPDDRFDAQDWQELLDALERTHQIAVLAHPEHYGGGTASYRAALLYPRDGSTVVPWGSERWCAVGLTLWVSRLGSVAVLGPGNVTFHKRSLRQTGWNLATVDALDRLPSSDPKWIKFRDLVRDIVLLRGIELLPTAPLLESCSRDLRNLTLWSPPYTVFDAIFYYSD